MNKCKCGALSRVNYSHGIKSNSTTLMLKEHSENCLYKKKQKRR